MSKPGQFRETSIDSLAVGAAWAALVAAAVSRLSIGGSPILAMSLLCTFVSLVAGSTALFRSFPGGPAIGSTNRGAGRLPRACAAGVLGLAFVLGRRYANGEIVPLRVMVVLLGAVVLCIAVSRTFPLKRADSSDASSAPVDGAGPSVTWRTGKHPSRSTAQMVGMVGLISAAVIGVGFGAPEAPAVVAPQSSAPSGSTAGSAPPTVPEVPEDFPLAIKDPPAAPAVLGSLSFTDASKEAGLVDPQSDQALDHIGVFAGGASVVDFNGDGRPDIYLPRVGLSDILYRNDGDGRFVDVTDAAGLPVGDRKRGSSVATWGDVDGDGDPDLYLTSADGDPIRLYLNQGNGRFKDGTKRSGLRGSVDAARYGSAFGDIDNDGDLDLVSLDYDDKWQNSSDAGAGSASSNSLCTSRERGDRMDGSGEGSRSVLWVNDGAGHFTDVTDVMVPGLGRSIGFTPTFADIDGDGWQDLLVTGDFCTSRVYKNESGRAFTDITDQIAVGTDENGMGSVIEDFDGDGRPDWFVTSISYPPGAVGEDRCRIPYTGCSGNRLWLNRGSRKWEDATDAFGVREGKWGWGAAAVDFDNDGDRDLVAVNGLRLGGTVPDVNQLNGYAGYFLENQTRLWMNTGTLPFVQAGSEAGLNSRGLAKSALPFDYDGDGDLDLLISRSEATPVLYRNNLDNRNRWLEIKLDDRGSKNRDGIGARIEVQSSDGGPIQVSQVRRSGTYGSALEPIAHFGLGPGVASVARVLVHWPDGKRTTTVEGLAPDALHVISPDD